MIQEKKDTVLFVSFLDVGQGDAIFIQAPSGIQVLIDGGPDRSILQELGQILPWYDRTIDVVIPTHPDMDHISGLIDVLGRYTVHHIIRSEVKTDTPAADVFEEAVQKEPAKKWLARRGQIINLGDGIYIEILFPDRDVSDLETNDASIVARLRYGKTSFLLTGDSPEKIEHYLVALDDEQLHSTVLKAGHHGSRTSTSLLFTGFVSPQYAVLSRGCENSYGHPHKEVLDTLERLSIIIKDTCRDGRVSFASDGTSVSIVP